MDNEALIMALAGSEKSSGGGGGGTTNYNALTNLPKVNGVILTGDKSTRDLKISFNDLEDKPAIPESTTVDSALSTTSENPVQNKVLAGALNALSEAVQTLDTEKANTETVESELAKKVDKVTGKGLSANDFTDALKTKLDALAEIKSIDDETLELSAAGKLSAKKQVTVDSALSETSTNPVQNKAVKTALDGKVDTVTGKGLSTNDFDNDAKKKLNDLPENADLQDALDAKAAQSEVNALANAGAKNLLKNGADSVTKTYNGVTATLNSDGSLTINGTATSDFYYYFVKDFVLKAGKYILSNGKAGNSNVMLQMNGEATASVVATEAEVTLETDATVNIFARVRSGGTANNITFYPMLRSASITDDTYVPYGMSNAELTAKKQDAGNYVNNGSGALPGGQTFTGGAAIGYFRSSNVNKGIIISGSAASELSETAPLEYLRFNRVTKKIEHQIYDGTNWQTEATYSADEDTGWQTLTAGIQYRKKNGVVYLDMQGVTVSNPTTWATIGTLPAGYRPNTRVNTVGQAAGMSQPCGVMVNVGGQIQTMKFSDLTSNLTGVLAWVAFPV